jgi:hypothetical protein
MRALIAIGSVLGAAALSSCGGESDKTSSSEGSGSSCGCVDETLTWSQSAGFETGTLESCHTFTFVRLQLQGPTRMCTDPIESCDDIVRPGDIQTALEHPDVVAAFAASPVYFGVDTRPAGGAVFQMALGSRLIEFGAECNGAADCTDEPPGVRALRTLIVTLTQQIMLRPPCSNVF